MLLEYRLRIRDDIDSSDDLVVTSERGGTNPYLEGPPKGDGTSFDPLTGQSLCGAYSGAIVDVLTSGTDRVVTSVLEDADGRQRFAGRKAFVEIQVDGGGWETLTAGYLSLLRLTNGITYEYQVSDPMRVAQGYQAFAPYPTETILQYLARWPNRGCILGGPVIGGFGPIKDRGGWEMKVLRKGTAIAPYSNSYQLGLVAGYGPPNYVRSKAAPKTYEGALNPSVADRLQPGTPPADPTTISTFDQADALAVWRGVIVVIDDTTIALPCHPVGIADATSAGDAWTGVGPVCDNGIFVWGPTLTVSATAIRRVRMLTARPSEASPIYWTGHPVDLVTTLWDEAGLAWDATAIDDTKAALGRDLRLAIRITEPEDLSSYLQRAIFGPFGVGVRVNSAGDLETFATQIFPNTVPSTTIGDEDVPTGETSLPFELDESTSIRTVTFEHDRLVPSMWGGLTPQSNDGGIPGRINPWGSGSRAGAPAAPVDGFFLQHETFQRINGDPGAVGNREIGYKVPGMVYLAESWVPALAAWVDAKAAQIFDRYGRGLVVGETVLLRGGAGDAVLLGDEILLDIAQLPNRNKRIGDVPATAARAMQVVRMTETPIGKSVRLADSGPNAQPLATGPTMSIAASGNLPRTVAAATITNAAALNVLRYAVRVQMAITTGGAPATGAYTDVAYFAESLVPTAAFALPAVAAGRKVYVRARTEHPGSRPSNWSAAVSVTLSDIDDPTSVTATPSGTDGSIAIISWVIGANAGACLTDVYVRPSAAAFAAAVRRVVVNPGSTRYYLEGLTPGTTYKASVQHRDPLTNDVSDPVDVSFTAGATTRTLAAPVYGFGYSGSIDPFMGIPMRDGIFGMGVVASEYPGTVEFAVATETAVASGVYSAFATVAAVQSVMANWTKLEQTAANDGRRRQIKARQVGDGVTSSAYTAVVTVLPWTPLALPPYPTQIFLELETLDPATPSDAGVYYRFQATGIDPSGGSVLVRIKSITANVAVAAGLAVGTYGASPQTWKITQPTANLSAGGVVVEALVSDGRTVTMPLTIPVSPAEQARATAVPIAVGAVDADGNYSVDVNYGPGSIQWATSSSAFPSDATVLAASGTLTNAGGGAIPFPAVITGTIADFGDVVYISIIGWSGVAASGRQLPTTHLRLAWQTFQATKTYLYSPAQFVQSYAYHRDSPFASSLYGGGEVFTRNDDVLGEPALRIQDGLALGLGINGVGALINVLLPEGVTIVELASDLYLNEAFQISTYLMRVGTSYTIVASVTASNTGTFATYTDSCSEATSGRRYQILAAIGNDTSGSGPLISSYNNYGQGAVAVTFTMPTPAEAL